MKLVTVGTGCAIPVKDRASTCNLLQVGNSVYFFDAGTSVAETMANLGYDTQMLRAIFVTHAHADHICGLPQMVNLYNWYYKNHNLKLYLPNEKCVDYCKALCTTIDCVEMREGIEFNVYQNGVIYKDENIKVTAFNSDHIPNAHSLLVEAEGKRILITGDLENTMSSLTDTAFTKPHDLIVVEGAHFSEDVIRDIFPKLNTRKLVVAHVGLSIPLARFEKILDECCKNVTIAKDGQEFIL